MLKCQDRYVNNRLLGFISRPQYESSCSISALTAVFNYLYAAEIGIKTTRELANVLGLDVEGPFNPGNQTIMKWFDKLCRHFRVKGSGTYFLRGQDVENWNKNLQQFTRLKEIIRSNDAAIIYHMKNHYTNIIGFSESSESPDDAYCSNIKLKRDIIFGEHSDHNPIPPLVMFIIERFLGVDVSNLIMDHLKGPVWSRRWRCIRNDLMNESNHCLLIFGKSD